VYHEGGIAACRPDHHTDCMNIWNHDRETLNQGTRASSVNITPKTNLRGGISNENNYSKQRK
jgi:hypothetical protein